MPMNQVHFRDSAVKLRMPADDNTDYDGFGVVAGCEKVPPASLSVGVFSLSLRLSIVLGLCPYLSQSLGIPRSLPLGSFLSPHFFFPGPCCFVAGFAGGGRG